jgi:hypothetical protein
MKLPALILLCMLCGGCSTVPTDSALNAELRTLPDRSLIAFGTGMTAHDGGSTSIPLRFSNGDEYLLRCFCFGNLLIGSWKTNAWDKGYRFQISRIGQLDRVETIRVDSPLANRLSVLLLQFAEDPANKESSAWAVSLSKMMHRDTYYTGKAAAGFMSW